MRPQKLLVLPFLLLVPVACGGAPDDPADTAPEPASTAGDTAEEPLIASPWQPASKHYCSPSTWRCTDTHTSAHCSADGKSDVQITDCVGAYGVKCNNATGRCGLCTPNTWSCNGGWSSLCASSGMGATWGLSCPAVYGTDCLPATGKCGCVPGQWQCLQGENVAGRCNATGTGWVDRVDCGVQGRSCSAGVCR